MRLCVANDAWYGVVPRTHPGGGHFGVWHQVEHENWVWGLFDCGRVLFTVRCFIANIVFSRNDAVEFCKTINVGV